MRYPTVLQHSEEDCGAACLATVARYYGRLLTIGHGREVVGTGQLGTTLLGLERGAQALGFEAQAVQASPALIDPRSWGRLPWRVTVTPLAQSPAIAIGLAIGRFPVRPALLFAVPVLLFVVPVPLVLLETGSARPGR